MARSSTASRKPTCCSKLGGGITTPSVRTARRDTDHRRRKLIHRQCCPPVPLRSTSGQHWRWRRKCTNNQHGPFGGGRSAQQYCLPRADLPVRSGSSPPRHIACGSPDGCLLQPLARTALSVLRSSSFLTVTTMNPKHSLILRGQSVY